jgi:hypothetical protein
MVRNLSMISAILYGKPEHRNARSSLRLIGAAFSLHRTFAAVGIAIRLSEHLLWPHMPAVFGVIDGYNLSCEAHEYLWKIVRKVLPAINRTSPTAITELTLRLAAQNFGQYLRVERHDKSRNGKLQRWWKDQAFDRMTIEGDTTALQAMLARYRFDRDVWWHEEKAAVILHVASSDTVWGSPAVASISESVAAVADLHQKYIYRTASIANARKLGVAVAPQRPTTLPAAPSPDPSADIASSTTVIDDDDDSSDMD